MNDNFETPCRQLLGKHLHNFVTTLREVYLCPALWVVYSHSLHQKKTLIDLRLISKPPFSEETAWHQGFYWGPPPYLAIGHQAPGTVAQIGRWVRGISLTPLIGGSVQPDGIVDQGEQGRGYFVVHQTAAEKAKMFFIVLLT